MKEEEGHSTENTHHDGSREDGGGLEVEGSRWLRGHRATEREDLPVARAGDCSCVGVQALCHHCYVIGGSAQALSVNALMPHGISVLPATDYRTGVQSLGLSEPPFVHL